MRAPGEPDFLLTLQSMKNPRVETLFYEVKGGKTVTYDDPAELDFSNSIGRFTTLNGVLHIQPTAHFVRESSARSVVEPFLETWRVCANLESGCSDTIRFQFLKSQIIDLDPPLPGESQTIYVEVGDYVTVFGDVSFHVTRRSYPASPLFVGGLSPNAESAYLRWIAYKEGSEPLQAMAYFVLTILEGVGNNRRTRAAANYQIDKPILDEIGRLTSTRGSNLTARKAGASGDLLGGERDWLERAIPRTILRIAETDAGMSTTRLTFADI